MVEEELDITMFNGLYSRVDVDVSRDELRNSRSTVPTDVEQEPDYETDDEDLLYRTVQWMRTLFPGNGQWIGGVGKGSFSAGVENEADVDDFDNETMHGAIESNEECIGNKVGSDGEEDRDGFPEFNPKTDMHNPQFCLGMKFATPKILRAAVREKAIQKGWEAFFVKSDRDRIKVICKAQNCPFELYASKMKHVNTCARVKDNSMIRVPYLTEKYAEQIKLNPDWSTEALAQAMSTGVKVRVSNQQAYRTKKAPLAHLEADIKEQYARIRDYGDELRRADPNTTIDIKCDFSEGQLPVFKQMYICLGALKMGFRAGCRSILGLDGCHLKSCYGGQLLTAMGLDANNTAWVLAYAMVKLGILTARLGFWTYLGFCVRHLWTNFNKLFPGKVMKDQLWACAEATTKNFFYQGNGPDEPIGSFSMGMANAPAKHWSRAHFGTHRKCDIFLNNLSESFNAFIVPARKKPIVSCFEEIRVKLMRRIQVRRDKMLKHEDTICPKPREILEKNKVKAATDFIPSGSGGPQIEVASIGGRKYVVNLKAHTCACRGWDLTGIPCKHAVLAIHYMRHAPEEYVDQCYLKKTCMAIYANTIKPVNGMDLWSKSVEPPILPPQYTRQPGRPKMKRMKDAAKKEEANGGIKLGRVQKSLKCSNCQQLGHNVKTCHRHLPPKDKTSTSSGKKRKLDASKTETQV
ncbi:uncharacterized protein LOC112199041 [Rosa chinensis]|uniref:uncharacterized protein LOC112199041 n=1 Tax=Rosa chinensis TaxID=74649 RepID=UPI000D08F5BB|nr:uncharacterized protein LOC112199041 [Rosa chinensis]